MTIDVDSGISDEAKNFKAPEGKQEEKEVKEVDMGELVKEMGYFLKGELEKQLKAYEEYMDIDVDIEEGDPREQAGSFAEGLISFGNKEKIGVFFKEKAESFLKEKYPDFFSEGSQFWEPVVKSNESNDFGDDEWAASNKQRFNDIYLPFGTEDEKKTKKNVVIDIGFNCEIGGHDNHVSAVLNRIYGKNVEKFFNQRGFKINSMYGRDRYIEGDDVL